MLITLHSVAYVFQETFAKHLIKKQAYVPNVKMAIISIEFFRITMPGQVFTGSNTQHNAQNAVFYLASFVVLQIPVANAIQVSSGTRLEEIASQFKDQYLTVRPTPMCQIVQNAQQITTSVVIPVHNAL